MRLDWAAIGVVAGLLAVFAGPAPLEVGDGRQLFLDDFLVDRWGGLSLKMHSPERREVAIAREHPWEDEGVAQMTVIQDGGRFRAWYRCLAGGQNRACYAESPDGVRWTKPVLNLIEFNGSTANNIVLASSRGGNLMVLKDPNPAVPEGERYKGIVRGRNRIYAYVSPDGLRWRSFREEPLIDSHPVDSHNILFWDPWQRHYVIYLRGIRPVPGSPKDATSWKSMGVRWVRRSVSQNFRDWSETELIEAGNAPIEQYYTSSAIPYERAAGTYLMFPSRFVVEREPVPGWPHGTGVNDIVLLSSRDGLRWQRTFREAFLRPGPDPNIWHERGLYMEHGIVQTAPHELSMYAMHNWRMPDNHIRRVTMRVDGFGSLHGTYEGGVLTTRPLMFSGRELEINFATSAAGTVRVGLRTAANDPITGFGLEDCEEIYGDALERLVAWGGKSDLSALRGKPVRLWIELRDADLYSFRFRGP